MKEVETKLQKRTSTAGKILDSWFRPHFFDNPKLYERLGVRLYKDYLHTRQKARNSKILDLCSSPHHIDKPNLESLRSARDHTKLDETAHLIGFISILGVTTIVRDDIPSVLLIMTMNVFSQAYPVMVQRYNRIRLNRLISRMEARNQRGNSKLPDFVT